MNINRVITSISLILALSTSVMSANVMINGDDSGANSSSASSIEDVEKQLNASTRFAEIKGDADKKPLYDECVAYCNKVPTYNSSINEQKQAVLQSAQDMLTASQACMAEIAKIEESGRNIRAVDVEFLEGYYGRVKTAEETYLTNFNNFKTAVDQMPTPTPKPTPKATKKPATKSSGSSSGGNSGSSGGSSGSSSGDGSVIVPAIYPPPTKKTLPNASGSGNVDPTRGYL